MDITVSMPQDHLTRRLPWEDRWAEPTLDQLMEPIVPQPRKALKTLMEQVEELGQVERSVTWYGPAWKWTLEYLLQDEQGADLNVLCYLVPSTASPVICVPLTEDVVERLPMRRLNRFIRNGIRSAKCAVSIHWAVWNLTAVAEAGHLMDLIKRKHKILSTPAKAAKV